MKHWVILGICLCVAVEASKISSRNQQLQAPTSPCHKWKCGVGWFPKAGHHELFGLSNEACCERTCKLWTCGFGYLSNEAYAENVAQDDQLCCDRICSDEIKCPVGHKKNPAVMRLAGSSVEECCAPTCWLFECPKEWSTDHQKSQSIGNTSAECCKGHCSLHNCSAGYVADDTVLGELGNTDHECCHRQCSIFTCPLGFLVHPEKNATIGNSKEECCEPLCSSFTCGFGWARNTTANREFGNTSEACCLKTCAQHNCDLSEGWANSSRKLSLIGENVSACCEPTCRQHSCSDGWLGFKKTENVSAQTDDDCCFKTCKNYTCDSLLRGKVTASTCVSTWGVTGKRFGIELDTYNRFSYKFTTGSPIMAGGVMYYVDDMQHHSDCNKNVGLVYVTSKKECAGNKSQECDSGSTLTHQLQAGQDEWSLNPGSLQLVADPILGDERVGKSDYACCEPTHCQLLRENKTFAEHGCESADKDDCGKFYYRFRRKRQISMNVGITWTAVECIRDERFGICKNGGKRTTGCGWF